MQQTTEYAPGTVVIHTAPGSDTKTPAYVTAADPAADRYTLVLVTSPDSPVTVPAAELEPAPALPDLRTSQGEPSDWWTVMDQSGREITRVHTPKASEVFDAACRTSRDARDTARRDGGLSYRRLGVNELTDAERDA